MGNLIKNKMSKRQEADCKKDANALAVVEVTKKGSRIYKLESITQEEREKIRPYALGYIM